MQARSQPRVKGGSRGFFLQLSRCGYINSVERGVRSGMNMSGFTVADCVPGVIWELAKEV